MKSHIFPPRMKQLGARRSATMAVLDVGTSKIVCIIARLTPVGDGSAARAHASRAHARHRPPALARREGRPDRRYGGGRDARCAARSTRPSAWPGRRSTRSSSPPRAGGSPRSISPAKTRVHSGAVAPADVHRVLEASARSCDGARPRRRSIRCPPASRWTAPPAFASRPAWSAASSASISMSPAAIRRRCAICSSRSNAATSASRPSSASPYVAGLSVLDDDEAELGAIVIDMGAGAPRSPSSPAARSRMSMR